MLKIFVIPQEIKQNNIKLRTGIYIQINVDMSCEECEYQTVGVKICIKHLDS